MKYYKYINKMDRSWTLGVIYKMNEDGSIPFGGVHTHMCDAQTLANCLRKGGYFEESTEAEYLTQENPRNQPLIFN